MSGALSQLGKLDFVPATIAIVALGFGADSIKNLLTQPRKKKSILAAAAARREPLLPSEAAQLNRTPSAFCMGQAPPLVIREA